MTDKPDPCKDCTEISQTGCKGCEYDMPDKKPWQMPEWMKKIIDGYGNGITSAWVTEQMQYQSDFCDPMAYHVVMLLDYLHAAGLLGDELQECETCCGRFPKDHFSNDDSKECHACVLSSSDTTAYSKRIAELEGKLKEKNIAHFDLDNSYDELELEFKEVQHNNKQLQSKHTAIRERARELLLTEKASNLGKGRVYNFLKQLATDKGE